MIFTAALTAAGFLLPVFVPEHKQVQATGRIVCTSGKNQIPLAGVFVNLQEYDYFDPDDFIANTTTDSSGSFYLNGSHTEVGTKFLLSLADFLTPVQSTSFSHLDYSAIHMGALAKCDRHLRQSKESQGLDLINRDENNGTCSKNCAIVAKVEIPRNYNFQEGNEFPPILELGNYDLAAKGKIECDESIADLRSLLAEKQMEFDEATHSFRTAIHIKNQRIKQLEEQLGRSKVNKLEHQVDRLRDERHAIEGNSMASEIRDLRVMLAKMDSITRNLPDIGGNGETSSATSGTLRARFTAISKLATNKYSNSIKVAGMDWAIMICSKADGPATYLSAYLSNISRDILYTWSCSASFTIKLLRHSSKDNPHSVDYSGIVLTPSRASWGRQNFIGFEELLNPANDFVKEDSILMEIDFAIYPTH
ncbi:hypothetical protein PRIPAC_85407 [Pristionchus pacificus]|uniref:MATH domain-containing protein n=1 Tax=Pristionchus pacificus TaxID=54126 RepID=A0A2A6BLP9_PRIPA|nr:hypothetical protein PRIPAC_85407 [Pristionchus pacificus]|eukprot:PDM66829.1 hypothetical protein PRIPAC_48246 [Pristionchus pacificus]